MRAYLRLTLVQLRGLLAASGRRRTRSKPRAWPSAAVFGLTSLLIAAFSAAYSFPLAFALAGQQSADLVLILMPAVGMLVALGIGSQGAGSFVFGGRDNDLLLSLPIPRTMLAAAKLSALLAEDALVLLSVVVPAAAAYALVAATPWFYWPAIVAYGFLLGCVATTASSLIGMLLTFVASRGRGAWVNNIVAIGVLAGFVLGWTAVQNMLRDRLVADPTTLRGDLAAWLPLFAWGRDAAVDGSLPALGLLAAAGLVPLAALSWLIGRSFVTLVSALNVRRGRARSADLGALRVRTPLAALVRRESQRYFGTTIYFVNTALGLIFVALGAVYLLVTRTLPAGIEEVGAALHVSPALFAAIAATATVSLSQTTAPSISLEGHRLWLLKSSPVATKTILHAKLAFNLVLTAPVLALFALAFAVAGRPSPVEGLLVLAAPLAANLAIAVLGLIDNLRWPNLDAANDTAAVKQGASVALTLLGGFLLTAILSVLGVLVTLVAGSAAGLAAMLGLSLAVAGGLYALLRGWGVRAFETLE